MEKPPLSNSNRLKTPPQPDAATEDVASLPSANKWSQLLECPVCNEIPFPQIYTCTSGHSVCPECCKRLKECPLCKAAFSKSSRNFFMESIVASTKFFCKNQSLGCKEEILGETYQKHLLQCAYRNKGKDGMKVKGGSSASASSSKPEPPPPTRSSASSSSRRPRSSSRPTSSRSKPPSAAAPPPSQRTGTGSEKSQRTPSHPSKCNGSSSNSSRSSSDANSRNHSASTVLIRGCYRWISSSANDPIPEDALQGGMEEGVRLYVGRAKSNGGGLIPGKIHAQSRSLSFPWGGRERTQNEYEVLTAIPDTLKWTTFQNGIMPKDAVIGGRTDIGEALYVGRCGMKGTLVVGWVLPSKMSVTVTSQGKECTSTVFEVLTKTDLAIELDRYNN